MILLYKDINIDIPYDAICVEDFNIISEINEHIYLTLNLLIDEEKVSQYINKNMYNEKITVTYSDGTKIFVGKITDINIIYKDDIYMMILKSISYTKDFDIKKNSRTFCNLDSTYNDIIEEVLSSYNKGNYIDTISNQTVIDDFILQYEETDWAFLKRLATHFNSILVPDCLDDFGKFYFGLPEYNSNKTIKLEDYKIIRNIDVYNEDVSLGIEDVLASEYTKWEIVTKEKLKLGEEVIFNDVRCIVVKIQMEVYKEEIRSIYTLSVKSGVVTHYTTNNKIFGMSIPATVQEVKGNIMKVHFEIDKTYKSYSNEKYFTYAIESSSWYCMPEKGSTVHIYFPSNYEYEAIAIHALRNTSSNAKYASKTQNPDNKSFSHKSGSEMQLTPSNISFTSDAGGASNIVLSQSGDVNISGKNINFTTIDMELGGDKSKPKTVNIIAKEEIKISQASSNTIGITNDVNIKNTKTKYDGELKEAAEIPENIQSDVEARSADGYKNEDMIKKINDNAEDVVNQKIDESESKFFSGTVAEVIGTGVMIFGSTLLLATPAAGVGIMALGFIGAEMGESKAKEATSDYSKALGGDYTKSDNFVRDTVFGGNQEAYDTFFYATMAVDTVALAAFTGGVGGVIGVGGDTGTGVAMKAMHDYGNYIDDSTWQDYAKAGIDMAAYGQLFRLGGKGVKKTLGAANKAFNITGKASSLANKAFDAIGKTKAGKALNKAWEKSKTIANKAKDYVFDPVDAVTGSLHVPAVDVVLPDIHEEFKIERKYESINFEVGIFGRGWLSNIELYLKNVDDKIQVLCNDGHFEEFYAKHKEYINSKGGSCNYNLRKENEYWIFKDNKERKIYRFNEDGRLIDITNKYGNKLEVNYINNNIDFIKTFSNYKLEFMYQDGKVIQIKDELGRIVQYKYTYDYLTEVVHVDKGVTGYNYDENGYITSVRDQNGNTYIRNIFDKKGRVIRQEYPNGDFAKAIYDDSEKENTFYYNDSNRTEKTKYNNDGLITHMYYSDGSFVEYKYDEFQNRIYEKDRNNNENFKIYNKYGSLIKETKANGLVTEYEYDEEENLVKETDNLGKVILNTYDSSGSLLEKKTKISVGKWNVEKFKYDMSGRIISKIDGNNNETCYEYAEESAGNGKLSKDPIKVITSSGYVYKYTYDKVGRNTTITTDYGTIEFGYNNLNYVSEIKDANGNITKKYYDKMGNLTSIYPPNLVINGKQGDKGYHYEYDEMDRLITIKNPLGYVNKNIRDSEGNIIKEVNPNYYEQVTQNGIGIEYVYDKNNRKIKAIYPEDSGVERFFYDANGNIVKHVTPEYYDEAKDDGLGYSYTYDENNNLKSIINEENIVFKTLEYDLHGNVIKETDSDGNSTLYKYDLVSNMIEKRVPSKKSKDGETLYNVIYYEYDLNNNKIAEKYGIDFVRNEEDCHRFNEIQFKYDAENRIIEVSDKYGAKTKYLYDSLNHKTFESFKINDNTTKAVHYIYDKIGNLIEKKEEINGKFIAPEKQGKNIWSTTKYKYDKNGNVTKILTPKGFEIGRVYDELDRVVLQYEIDKTCRVYRSKVYKYDKADNIISLSEYSGEDARNITKKYLCDFDYNVEFFERYNNSKKFEKLLEDKNFEFDKRKKSYKYDTENRLTHFINISGNTTRLFYDKNARIIKQVLPEQYDETIDDGEGTTYSYNVKGQVVEVKNALGETVTKNTYDVKGNLKTTIDGEKNKVEYTYTLLGQIKDITTPNSRKENKTAQSYSYDARGNIIGIIDGKCNETKYLLDNWGRIVQITTPEGGTEKYTYDYAGNITSTTDANGNTIQYFYNSLGQVYEIKDQEGASEYFYYDEEGNLIKQIDRNENIVDRIYNLDKNIVSIEAYKLNKDLLQKDKLKRNNNSNLQGLDSTNLLIEDNHKKRSIDFRKRVIDKLDQKEKGLNNSEDTNDITSNATHEKTEITSKDKKSYINDKYKLNLIRQNFKYNPDGTLSNANFNNMYYNYEYNAEGLLERKSASGKTLLSYTYDKNNNIKTLQDITNKRSTYTYDKANRLKTIQDDNNKIQAQYEYYSNDNIKSVTLGNGVKSDYTYDGDGNISSLVTVTQNGEVLVDYSYAYDLNGNRLQKVSSKHKNYYSYDSMNRLVDSSYDGRKESFTYDKVGNRLTKTTEDITEKYVYNVKNQLKELHNKAGVTFFAYDKQGNTIKEQTSNGNNLFEYNALNQQVKAITKEGNTLVSRYDSEGLRYEIEENEKLSKFIYNKKGNTYSHAFVGVSSTDQNKFWGVTYDEILVETDKDDNVVSRFTRGYDIVSADVDNKKYYYSVDEQGSTEFITDVSGNVKNEYRYDAFGNVLESKEDIHNRITYTGQQFDIITAQYYLRARYYNPIIGRFTQEDVYRGDGLNLYAYCGNNPVIYYDPSGYEEKLTYNNCDIIINGKKVGKVSYRTGKNLDIMLNDRVINNLNNTLELNTKAGGSTIGRIFNNKNILATVRGKEVENVIARQVINDYIQIGDGLGGHFPVIDLANKKKVISIKSMNIFGKSCYATDAAGNIIYNGKHPKFDVDSMLNRVKTYYKQIDNIKITVNGQEIKKELHLEIPKGDSVNKYKRAIKKGMKEYIKNVKSEKVAMGLCPRKGRTFFSVS